LAAVIDLLLGLMSVAFFLLFFVLVRWFDRI
jgi:hypothetical protein